MEDVAVWGIHAGRPRGSKEPEQKALALEIDGLFKGAGGRGTIAVGWPELGDLSALAADRDAFKARVAEANPDATAQSITADAATLFAFVAEATEGDVVVWRSPQTRDVWIGRIRGPYVYSPDAHDEYVNRRPVSWQPPRPLTDFSKEALRSLGQQRSFFRVKNEAEFRRFAMGLPGWMQPAAVGSTGETERA